MNTKTELKDIHLSEGMTAEEYLKTVPEQYKLEVISAISLATSTNKFELDYL